MTEKKTPPRAAARLQPRAGSAKARPAKAASAPVADAANTVAPPLEQASGPSVEQTVARHQKALAEALEQAATIEYGAAAPAGKGAKPGKTKKPKLVRDSYAMPEAEHAQLALLKKRLAGLGQESRKSELLRAGLVLLAALNDVELQAVMGRVERIKTGRPSKK